MEKEIKTRIVSGMMKAKRATEIRWSENEIRENEWR